MMMTHKYVEVVTISPAAGVPASYQFTTNGLYDPNVTGTGHQPSFFDNMTAIYDHYHVARSRCRFSILSTQSFRCSAYIDDDNTAAGDPTLAAEQASAKSRSFSLNPITTFRPVIKTLVWDSKDYFGGDIWDNTELQGTSASNPAELSNFTLSLQVADASTATTWIVSVELEYDAWWSEVKTQAQN